MVSFFKLFFFQNDLLRYTSFDGERNSRPTCAFMVTVSWLEAGLFVDACFTSTLFNSVSMTHISRLTGPLPLSLYANTEIIDLFTDGATTLKKGVNMPTFHFLSTRPGWPLVSATTKINALTNWELAAEKKPCCYANPNGMGINPKFM